MLESLLDSKLRILCICETNSPAIRSFVDRIGTAVVPSIMAYHLLPCINLEREKDLHTSKRQRVDPFTL